jgi:hypothetical protein
MILITYIMMSFQIRKKSLTVCENMNHIIHHDGCCFWSQWSSLCPS